jgi:hypothetical protein
VRSIARSRAGLEWHRRVVARVVFEGKKAFCTSRERTKSTPSPVTRPLPALRRSHTHVKDSHSPPSRFLTAVYDKPRRLPIALKGDARDTALRL